MLVLNSHAWELGKSFTPSSLSFTQFTSTLVSTWLCIKRIMAAYGASPSSLLPSLHECWWGARIFNYGFALPCMASCFIWSNRRTSAQADYAEPSKNLMASFWAINTRASCSQVHVFFNLLLMRFNQKEACANKPVYYCTNFTCQFFIAWADVRFACNRWKWTWISTETDVCCMLFTEETGFFLQTFDMVGWFFFFWFFLMTPYNCWYICHGNILEIP